MLIREETEYWRLSNQDTTDPLISFFFLPFHRVFFVVLFHFVDTVQSAITSGSVVQHMSRQITVMAEQKRAFLGEKMGAIKSSQLPPAIEGASRNKTVEKEDSEGEGSMMYTGEHREADSSWTCTCHVILSVGQKPSQFTLGCGEKTTNERERESLHLRQDS